MGIVIMYDVPEMLISHQYHIIVGNVIVYIVPKMVISVGHHIAVYNDTIIVLKMVISASSSTSLNGGICFRGKSMLLSHFLLFLLIYYLFHFIFFYDAIYTRIPRYSWALLAISDNLNFFYNPLNKSLDKFLMCDNRHGH